MFPHEENGYVEGHREECGEERRSAEAVEIGIGGGECEGMFVIVDEGGVRKEETGWSTGQ